MWPERRSPSRGTRDKGNRELGPDLGARRGYETGPDWRAGLTSLDTAPARSQLIGPMLARAPFPGLPVAAVCGARMALYLLSAGPLASVVRKMTTRPVSESGSVEIGKLIGTVMSLTGAIAV